MQQEFWGLFIVCGFAAMCLAQLVAAILSFSVSPLKGFFALFVPGYLFLVLKQAGHYWKVVGLWGAGVFAVIAGTIAMS